MTYKQLLELLESYSAKTLRELERAIKSNHVATRRAALDTINRLWTAASNAPDKTAAGNMAYVSRAEAIKYGRLEKMQSELAEIINKAKRADVRHVEAALKSTYIDRHTAETYLASAVHGYNVKGRIAAKLVANSVYSDFYGGRYDHFLAVNWSAYQDRILGAVNRGLNTGRSYTSLAAEIKDLSNRNYSDALRVARTEAGRVASEASLDSHGLLDELGVPYRKRWLATIDDRTRGDHQVMDGEYADGEGIFTLPSGYRAPAPRLSGNAADDINCRCDHILEFDNQAATERRVRGEGIVPYETYLDRLKREGAIPSSKEISSARV
jgi:SPP1 gp7 family putative phage head morphogenesis protein